MSRIKVVLDHKCKFYGFCTELDVNTASSVHDAIGTEEGRQSCVPPIAKTGDRCLSIDCNRILDVHGKDTTD
jgi:hypothetical protein